MDSMKDKIETLLSIVWGEDIPSPTVPEYVEHHKSIQKILNFIDEEILSDETLDKTNKVWIDKMQTHKGISLSECHIDDCTRFSPSGRVGIDKEKRVLEINDKYGEVLCRFVIGTGFNDNTSEFMLDNPKVKEQWFSSLKEEACE